MNELPPQRPAASFAPPPVAPRAVRTLALLAILGLCAWLAHIGEQGVADLAPDFEYFFKGGRCLLATGTLDPGYDVVDGRVEPRGRLDWYLPSVPRLMTLPAAFGHPAGGYLWLGLNLAAIVVTLRLIGRHLTGLPPQDWPVTQLLPFLLLFVYWRWEVRLNQINMLTLLLLVATYVHWEQGRKLIAGFWLGLAVLLKLTPGLVVLWFALKRQWKTAGAALVTVALAGPAADVLALGPAPAADAYAAWADKAVHGGSHRALILEQREMDWRNQGLGAVLSRWLHPTNYNTHFDNDPRHQAEYGLSDARTLNLAQLSRATIGWIATGTILAILVGAAWLMRRPATSLNTWQTRLEWAVVLLVMLWLMPVMRRYHMIWTLPAISLIGGAIQYRGLRPAWSRLTLVCLGLAVATEFTLLSMPLEAAGTLLLSAGFIALPLVILLIQLQRNPGLLPEPYHRPNPPRATAGTPPVDAPPAPSARPAHVQA